MSTTPETFPVDHNGKQITCNRSEFVPAGANRFCIRPPHPASQPCAFPLDKAHLACQADLAAVRADLELSTRALERLTKAHEAAEKERGEIRSAALVALGYLELHAALPDGGNKQGAQDIALRLRKVLGVAP